MDGHVHNYRRVFLPTMSALQFDNVSKHYPGGPLALSEINFNVNAGEMLFITGPSGAGKSTLLKLIYLVERPSAGAVLLDGRDLAQLRGADVAAHRRNIGVVFQDHRLLTDRSAFDNIALPLLLRRLPQAEIAPRVQQVLEQLSLTERADAPVYQLSTGEQQRIGIARALVVEPSLLVADEPIGNLDPELSDDVMRLFSALSERGTSVIVASHDLPVVKRMKRRVLILERGHLIDDIAPEDLADA